MDFVHWKRLRPGVSAGSPLVLAALLALAPQARAALGGDAASIAADQVRLHAAARMTAHALYEIHELTLPTGTVVREYAVPGGSVFAVGWNGPALPDLQHTLGASFAQFVAAAGANTGGHHYLAAHAADLVVVSTGRMRAFSGHAYLASAVPAGVPLAELQ